MVSAGSSPGERITTQVRVDSTSDSGRPSEREAWSGPGVLVLFIGIGEVMLAGTLIGLGAAAGGSSGAGSAALLAVGIALIIVANLTFRGLTAVVPGEARVVQLFGRYHGTLRSSGLRWVNPFAERRRVSVRVRNHETAVAKVNDADGNPIEIAAVVVWQVRDTAQAMYAVDDYSKFVAIQTEAAVRHTASSYPYDARGSGALSLRDNAEEITQRLSEEITDRVRPAGVTIVESRLTRLSYAPEIAQAMLRQQQANAVVAARQRIVEGAVGMVELALQRLEERGVVELDEERKAAMVSNLLVVLCSEQATQQVVNTGSLYQ
ncbi:MAG: SPFH domain-containing protein [Acidimicrobiaceae bacterium]|nr:SPFH domain-containing protein [Acidimicrobiaceae bacterium]